MLHRFITLRPGEKNLVLSLFGLSALVGLARTFTAAAAFSLFLGDYGAGQLPYVYLATSLAVMGLTAFYLRLQKGLSFLHLTGTALAFLAAMLLAQRLALHGPGASWVVMALPVWFGIENALLGQVFWSLANRLTDVRQSKRLFGIIGTGEVLATVIGGLLIQVIVTYWSSEDLLWLSLGAVSLLYLGSRPLARQASAGSSPGPGPAAGGGEAPEPARPLFKDPYILLIAAVSMSSMVAYYFVDNLFYFGASERYPDSEALAGFLGLFSAAVAVATLGFRSLGLGWLLNRFGVRTALLAIPAVLLVCAALVFGVTWAEAPVVVVFAVTTLTKLLDKVGYSLTSTSQMILYQPLPKEQRTRAHAAVDGIAQQFGAAGGALLLLLITQVFPPGQREIAGLLLLLVMAWIAAASVLGKRYQETLVAALGKRRFCGGAQWDCDRQCRTLLLRCLQSPNPAEVVYALELLAESPQAPSPREQEQIFALLDHPAEEVRLEVLSHIRQRGLDLPMDRIEGHIAHERTPAIRAQALRLYAELAGSDAVDLVLPYLDDANETMRRGAMVGLLRSGGMRGVLRAGAALLQCIGAESAAQRRFGAEVIGEVGVREFYDPLEDLLRDPDTTVRRAALAAAGRLANPRLWPRVLDNLDQPAVHAAAVSALAHPDPGLTPLLERRFADYPSRAVRLGVIQAYGRVCTAHSARALLRKIDLADRELVFHALRGLHRCRQPAEVANLPAAQAQLERALELELEAAHWLRGTRATIAAAPALRPLAPAAEHAFQQSCERLFLLLALEFEPKTVLRARDHLLAADARDAGADQRAYALETLDNLLPRELSPRLLPLLDPSAEAAAPAEAASWIDEALHATLRWRLDWLLAALLHTAFKGGQRLPEPHLEALLDHPEPLVRELGVVLFWRAERAGFRRRAAHLRQDPAAQIRALVQTLEPLELEPPLYPLFDKVVALKGVEIFSALDASLLAKIAPRAEEVQAGADELLIRQGAQEDFLFILLHGEVEVQRGPHAITRLGPGEIVGEFALIDQAPRSASVHTLKPCRLLRLSRATFSELLAEEPAIGRGVIRVLCRRFRRLMSHPASPRTRPRLSADPAPPPDRLLGIDRILLLKAVGLFQHAPLGVLGELSTQMQAVRVAAGETFIHKGEWGDCLYLVAAGEAEAFDGDQHLGLLREKDVVGELAVLDAEPRSASVRAVSELMLLRLDRGALNELLAEHTEIVQGIIRELARRIRSLLA